MELREKIPLNGSPNHALADGCQSRSFVFGGSHSAVMFEAVFSALHAFGQGFGFLGFIVDDLDGASESLRAKGFEEIPEPSMFKGKLTRFRDPDGYHIQLAKRKSVLE